MADLKLTVNFIPDGGSIAALRTEIEKNLGTIAVKFTADTSGLTGKNGLGSVVSSVGGSSTLRGLTDVNTMLAACQIQLKGVAGAKKQYAVEVARETAAMKIQQQTYDVSKKQSQSETAATNKKLADLRLLNAETAKADKENRQAAASERKARQNDVDYQYLKRQSQDYYNQNKKNITLNKELSASWDDYMKNAGDKSKWKDPLENRNRLNELKEQTRAAGAEIETLGQRIKRLFGQHFDTALVMVGINAMRQALQLVYKNVVELDAAVVDLQIATGGSRSEMQALLADYSKLGQEIGATTLEVAQSSDTFLRQGKTIQETETLVRNSLMLSKLGQIESAEASDALTTAMKGYKVSVEDSLGIVDKLTAVDRVSASTAGGLAVSMAETATSANLAGVSMDKLIGQLAVVKEVSGDADESVGTFFRTLYARMGQVKAGELVDPETSESLSNVETVLTGYGVKLRNSNDQFRNFGDVLDEVASKWDTYGSVAKHAIATAFAGTRQQDKFLILMSNYATSLDYANVATNSAGTATEKYQAYLGGVEAHVNSLKAAFEALSTNLLSADSLNGAIDSGTGILSILNAITSSPLIQKVGLLNIALLTTVAIIGASGAIGLNGFANALYKVIAGMGVATGTATSLSMALSTLLPVAAIMVAVAVFKELNVTLEEQRGKLDNIRSEYHGVSTEIDNLSGKLADGTITPYEQARLTFLQQYRKELIAAEDIQERAVIKSELYGTGGVGSGGLIGEVYGMATTSPDIIAANALRGNNTKKASAGYDELTLSLSRLFEIQSQVSGYLDDASVIADPEMLRTTTEMYNFVGQQIRKYQSAIDRIIASGLVAYSEDVVDAVSSEAEAVATVTGAQTALQEEFAKTMSKSDALSSALKQQATDGYLSAESLTALKEAGVDYNAALVETGDDYTPYAISIEKMQEALANELGLERSMLKLKEREAQVRINDIYWRMNLGEISSEVAADQVDNINAEIAQYKLLEDQLYSLVSLMNAYKDAIETPNASSDFDYATGDMIGTINSGIESGRIATDEFKAAMSYFTDGSLVTAFTQADIPAIQTFFEEVSKYTQGGAAGLNEATKAFTQAGILDANGMFVEGTTLVDAANALGSNVGTEFAYSLLKSYEDYGFDINLKEIMQPEDWDAVTSEISKAADGYVETYDRLLGLQSEISQARFDGNVDDAKRLSNQVENLAASLSSSDIVAAINNMQALSDTGMVSEEDAQATIDKLNGLLDFKSQMDAIPIEVSDQASAAIASVSSALTALDGKRATTFIDMIVSGGATGGPGDDLSDTPGGMGRASGNANAGGTWGRGSGGKTLVGELGPEIVVDPATNRWYTVGDRGAQFANLPQNAIVFNHLQTQSILSQGRLGSRGKALAGGNAAYNRFQDDSDTTFGSWSATYMVTSDGGIAPIPTAPTAPKPTSTGPGAPSLSEVYSREIALRETQIKLTNDLLNMYETGTENWFNQQQYIIDNYKRQAALSQAEYNRLIASGADINSEDVQKVLQSLVEYKKEVFEASKEYWEAEKDNANTTLEHMKSQAEAVLDLKESYHDLMKSIRAEQRSIEAELRVASEAYPNLTDAERQAAFSGDDYQLLSNRLSLIAAEAASMQADYLTQIQNVSEESSYSLESITAEFEKQYELKLDAYNVAKNELAVIKAKKNLENVQNERSVAMLINGMWTWVADAENVADAIRNVSEAEQELADAQSDATFNAEAANISGVINQIDEQISAIDALVYSSDSLAEEVHTLVTTIQDQVIAAMSPASTSILSTLPTYSGTSTSLFNSAALQSLLSASIAQNGSSYLPTPTFSSDITSILGSMGSVKPAVTFGSSSTGDVVYIAQLTLTGDVASQFIAMLRAVAPLG